MMRDAQQLLMPMHRDLERAFNQLGRRAEKAFLQTGSVEVKAADPEDADRVSQMMRSMRIQDWQDSQLLSAYETAYLRTLTATADTVSLNLGLAVNLPDSVGRRVVKEGGRRMGLVDLQGQSRTAMFDALAAGREAGEAREQLADRIRGRIGRGRYRDVKTRAMVIARTETLHAQRFSCIQTYKGMDTINACRLWDAQIGATDAECEARNQTVVSFEEAEAAMNEEHPNGTLSIAPEVGQPSERRRTARQERME